MNFCSTRNSKLNTSSAVAIAKGLSDDGGLFVPMYFPKISIDDLKDMLALDYKGKAVKILSQYLTDYTAQEIASCVEKAYGANFDTPAVAPVVDMDKLNVCELWHGPTCAFKDMALQILPHLLTTATKKVGIEKKTVILVATSGDTGKAALEGFKNVTGTQIIVFYPQSGVSDIQRLQMATQEGENVNVFAIKGNFDNAQSGVKAIFSDNEFKAALDKRGYSFSSANSINFGRLVPQVVYYFSAYLDMVDLGKIEMGDKVNFTVPTGNFGNILAAYYAKCMGLPVNRLICASNSNNVLTDFISTGAYNKNRDFHLTTSPSMDILISSNLERLLYHVSGDDSLVADLMAELSANGKYRVSDEILAQIKEVFYADFADDNETANVINHVYEKKKYVVDTHTAVAVAVYGKYVKETGDTTPNVVMSTASPFKFCRAVNSALGESVSENDGDFKLLEALENYGIKAPKQLASLKEKPLRFNEVLEKENMKKAVEKSLL